MAKKATPTGQPKGKQGKPAKEAARVEPVAVRNRKARHEYEIVDSIEAGIRLTGTEVKSLRSGRASLEAAYARIDGDEVWLINAEIQEYEQGNRMNHDPKRKRKLLLHRREIRKFVERTAEKGFTIVPLRIYFRRGLAKVELAVGRGKKLYDKRQSLKDMEAKRDIQRAAGGGNG